MHVGDLRARVLVLAAMLALGFLLLMGRLAYLQVYRHAELSQMAERQYSRTVVLPARRGPIVDRHGDALATSSPAESLFAHPRGVGDPVRVASRLSPIIGVPPREIHAALTSGRSFVWLRRKLLPASAEQVRALREPGLGLVPEAMRLYPNRELAAHVVGFEGADGGLEGVERALESDLAGADGKVLVGRDALGRDVATQQVIEPAVAGSGVMLTIDRTIQYLAEREIDAAYRRTGARAAMAVAMDPRTGDVLAIAIRPTFNPNTFAEVPSRDALRNRAITDPFEPGSTFKAIMAAAALEEGVVKPDDSIYAEWGSITIARTTIRDWKRYGWLTFTEVLENSSNVGSIKVGLALGADRYYHYMTAFGFGAPTGVGLSGESRGQLREPSRWSALSLPTMSIGQEVSVTALQMVAAFGAIANGGTLMQPRIVRATFDADGQERRRVEPRAVRRVVSPETARTLTRILTQVVAHGTGKHAAIPGYEVAGKTGTAQKLDPATRRYSRAPGVLSFVGFVPADAPRVVMLVMLDEPKNEKWGSEAAAPIFAAIGREVLRYLDVPPRGAEPVQIVTGETRTARLTAVAQPRASEPGHPRRDPISRSDTEAPGHPRRDPISRSDTAAPGPLRPDPISRFDTDDPLAMPDLHGRTLRDALTALAPFKVDVQMAGRGVVVEQRPAPGAPVEPGTLAALTLGAPASALR